jgi:3-deoxy-manno-octulosonate cytidylyltransferase (CMP-KDO synthetase)
LEQADTVIVIPARYASTRFPGKPLHTLRGADGISRSLIEWSWRAATAAADGAAVVVATDDDRVADEVHRFGGQVAMTPTDLRNGTERCAYYAQSLPHPAKLVVNFQGDAPLIPPHFVSGLIEFALASNSAMATPYVACDAAMAGRLRDAVRSGQAGGTCVVVNNAGQALYFSKYPIPFGTDAALKMHVGLYAYTPAALALYASLPPSMAEESEGLEQLRFMDAGVAIDLLEMALPQSGLWELNNPDDVAVIEASLSSF